MPAHSIRQAGIRYRAKVTLRDRRHAGSSRTPAGTERRVKLGATARLQPVRAAAVTGNPWTMQKPPRAPSRRNRTNPTNEQTNSKLEPSAVHRVLERLAEIGRASGRERV